MTIRDDGILSQPNIVLGGDLNFTLSSMEVWEKGARLDPLAPFMFNLFHEVGLVDVEPSHLGPTWRNGRAEEVGIEKRLDRFLLFENLEGVVNQYRSWVFPLNVSDHMPIVLQLDTCMDMIKYPFKFNPIWLEEEDFVNFIKEKWNVMV